MAPSSNRSSVKKTAARLPGEPAAGTSSDSSYLAFVVWGALTTSALFFLGYVYLKYYNGVFGIEMGDFSYYEVLLYSYNVINVLSPRFLVALVLVVSFLFSGFLLVRRNGGRVRNVLSKTFHVPVLLLVPLMAVILSAFVWFFLKNSFDLAREAGVLKAQYVRSHLNQQNPIFFNLEKGLDSTLPREFLLANGRRELRLIAQGKQSYYVMRQSPSGFDPMVYEVPKAKVQMAVIAPAVP